MATMGRSTHPQIPASHQASYYDADDVCWVLQGCFNSTTNTSCRSFVIACNSCRRRRSRLAPTLVRSTWMQLCLFRLCICMPVLMQRAKGCAGLCAYGSLPDGMHVGPGSNQPTSQPGAETRRSGQASPAFDRGSAGLVHVSVMFVCSCVVSHAWRALCAPIMQHLP